MGKTEIIVLIITIFVSVGLLSIFLNRILKQKSNRDKKETKSQLESLEIKQPEKEETAPQTEEIKQEVKQEAKKEAPQISIALQNELDEFKDYLKSRVTKAPNEEDVFLHPYETPKLNSSYDQLPDNFFNDDFDPMQYKRPQKRENLEEQSNKIKILMLTDFFNTKF